MSANSSRKSSPLKTAAIVLFTIVVSVALAIWVMTRYIFPRDFEPVELSKNEQVILDKKLSIFQGWSDSFSASAETTDNTLQAEKYSEENADRTIEFSERELNALLANNTDLAQRLAINLSNNLASGKLLIPLDPDFPVMGGKTLKLTAGLELAYANERPIVVLKGVSVMGVPIPGAWLGGLKNVDLVSEFGDAGFWKAFATGVEFIKVEEGQLVIKLKE
jgi:hypothetical protein